MREYGADNWPDVLAYQVDPRYLRYYEWTERTPEIVQEFVQAFIDQQQAQPRTRFQLAVTLKRGGRLIGSCGIRVEPPVAREAHIGFELTPEHWGQGYAKEAAKAIVQFGFTDLRLHRIWSWCIADNSRSSRVLERLGMRLEGRICHKEYFKGRWWDTLRYAILEHEWHEQE